MQQNGEADNHRCWQSPPPNWPDPAQTLADIAARILPHEHRLLPEAVQLLAAGQLEVDAGIVRILLEK